MCFGLYTAKYEITEQIFYASTGRDFCHAVVGSDGIGMDDANYVHDEILVELWRGIIQFFGVNRTDDSVHHVDNRAIRYIYRNYFRL